MKVWIVKSEFLHQYQNEKVFESEEKAKNYIENSWCKQILSIEEWVVE